MLHDVSGLVREGACVCFSNLYLETNLPSIQWCHCDRTWHSTQEAVRRSSCSLHVQYTAGVDGKCLNMTVKLCFNPFHLKWTCTCRPWGKLKRDFIPPDMTWGRGVTFSGLLWRTAPCFSPQQLVLDVQWGSLWLALICGEGFGSGTNSQVLEAWGNISVLHLMYVNLTWYTHTHCWVGSELVFL